MVWMILRLSTIRMLVPSAMYISPFDVIAMPARKKVTSGHWQIWFKCLYRRINLVSVPDHLVSTIRNYLLVIQSRLDSTKLQFTNTLFRTGSLSRTVCNGADVKIHLSSKSILRIIISINYLFYEYCFSSIILLKLFYSSSLLRICCNQM